MRDEAALTFQHIHDPLAGEGDQDDHDHDDDHHDDHDHDHDYDDDDHHIGRGVDYYVEN